MRTYKRGLHSVKFNTRSPHVIETGSVVGDANKNDQEEVILHEESGEDVREVADVCKAKGKDGKDNETASGACDRTVVDVDIVSVPSGKEKRGRPPCSKNNRRKGHGGNKIDDDLRADL